MEAQSQPAVAMEARGVSKIFRGPEGDFHALESVSVSIAEGEFFTLLGPSGCGKTTLLRMIAGFEHPSAGQLLLHGEDISDLPPYRRQVNTVFQSYALFPHLSVAENIAFGLRMLGRPNAEVDQTVDRMLKLVKMEPMRNRLTSQISGGQQQRVALARALAPAPKVLLLDEPLSALDLKLRKEMQIELKRLQHETGITFIFVTHDQEEALTMSDRIAVMRDGHVLQIGAPREIYDQPANRFVASFIGETNFLSATSEGIVDGGVRIRIGDTVSVETDLPDGVDPKGDLTVVVRPEHIVLRERGAPDTLSATLTNAVYFGTDTHYHLELASGQHLIARRQNAAGAPERVEIGAAIGVTFAPSAARLLRD